MELPHLRLISTALVLMLAGCATHPKVDPTIDWKNRIGAYTYEQAVAELGKPDLIGESNEGRTAEWIMKRSPQVSFGLGVGHGVYGRHGGAGVGVGTSVSPTPRGEYLRLTFGPDGKLTGWSKMRH